MCGSLHMHRFIFFKIALKSISRTCLIPPPPPPSSLSSLQLLKNVLGGGAYLALYARSFFDLFYTNIVYSTSRILIISNIAVISF